jgi:hypothetical protein
MTLVNGKPSITLESLGFNMTPQDATKAWKKQKFIMLGESKTGKTSFWASAECKSFFFRTEAGHNHVSTVGADCRNFADIMEWKGRLMQAKNAGLFPFDAVVIDTGDRLIDYITEDVLDWARTKYSKNADNINSIGDIPEGNGWFLLKAKVNQFLKQLEELPCAVVLVFHTAQDTRTDEYNKSYKKDTINVGGKAGTAILAWADHILNVRSMYVGETLARKMICRGSKTIEAGSRANLPPSITWTDDNAKNFSEFRKLFE